MGTGSDTDAKRDSDEAEAPLATTSPPPDDDEDDASVDEDSPSPAVSDRPVAPADASAEPAGPPRGQRYLLLAILAVVVVALDLWSKAWAWDALREGQSITVVNDWIYFEFGFNTGSAFSLGRDAGWARTAFIVVTLLALVYMGRLAMTLPTRYGSAFVSIAMVAGGAIGNLHDRLFRVMEIRGEMRHGVVDFIKIFYWPGKVWPTFNVADVALVVGVGLLLIFLTKHGDALDAEAKRAKQG